MVLRARCEVVDVEAPSALPFAEHEAPVGHAFQRVTTRYYGIGYEQLSSAG